MESKPLKQAIDVALDSLGMQGPVTRRDVAEEVLRSTPEDHWSVGDEREAKLAYIISGVTERMGEPHSDHVLAQYLPRVPEKYRPVVRKLPRFICINPRGGRGAQHVMSVMATAADWAANFALKDYIAERTRISRDEARDIHDLLQHTGAQSLADLFRQDAAE